uniref:SelB domain-containing protein n=1 Tax=Streptomyces phytophilus TaxID=722715 RepID=UPI0015EFE380
LAEPLPLRIGDAGLLRHPGAHDIAAGVTVLDVRPPALRHRGAAAVRAEELQGMEGTPDGRSEVRRRGLIRTGELTAMGADVPFAPVAGDWLVDPARWAELGAELERVVGEHAREDPLAPGLTVADAGRRLGLPDMRLAAELVRAPLVVRDGRILPAAADRQLPPAVRSAVHALRRQLADAPFLAPDADGLRDLGLDDRALRAAVRTGALLRVDAGIYLLPGADTEAVRLLRALPQPFTVSQARQALGTTRRVATPLLEMLARQGHTHRTADGRHRVVD